MIDFEKNIPATDVTLIGTTNAVLVRDDIHPALIGLLAEALLETHNKAGLFQRAGEFPVQIDPEYSVASSVIDYYKNGPSLLHRYLPFWIVTHVQRVLALSLAAAAIFFPLFSYAPKMYLWYLSERTRKLYQRLRVVEKAMQKELTAPQVAALQIDLEHIDRAATILPMRHSDLFFSLKVHINLVRARLASLLVEAQR